MVHSHGHIGNGRPIYKKTDGVSQLGELASSTSTSVMVECCFKMLESRQQLDEMSGVPHEASSWVGNHKNRSAVMERSLTKDDAKLPLAGSKLLLALNPRLEGGAVLDDTLKSPQWSITESISRAAAETILGRKPVGGFDRIFRVAGGRAGTQDAIEVLDEQGLADGFHTRHRIGKWYIWILHPIRIQGSGHCRKKAIEFARQR